MKKTLDVRPGRTQYGQLACTVNGCNEPPLEPTPLCWTHTDPSRRTVWPASTFAEAFERRAQVAAVEDVHPDEQYAGEGDAGRGAVQTTGEALAYLPPVDDAARAKRLARSKAWHAAQKAKKAGVTTSV